MHLNVTRSVGCQVIKRKLQLAAYANFYAKIVFVNGKMYEIVTIVLISSVFCFTKMTKMFLSAFDHSLGENTLREAGEGVILQT